VPGTFIQITSRVENVAKVLQNISGRIFTLLFWACDDDVVFNSTGIMFGIEIWQHVLISNIHEDISQKLLTRADGLNVFTANQQATGTEQLLLGPGKNLALWRRAILPVSPKCCDEQMKIKIKDKT
jgi:hypothetical protein